MTYPLRPDQLPPGEYEHGIKTSQTESKPRGGWLNELRIHFGDNLVCAAYGCTQPADLGAHLRVGVFAELSAFVGRGGQAVVPCCNFHHNKTGGTMRTKASPCVWDPNSPYDL